MSATRQRKSRTAQQDPEVAPPEPGDTTGTPQGDPDAPEGGDGEEGTLVDLDPDPVEVQAAERARVEELAAMVAEQYAPLKTPPPATGPLEAPNVDAGQALTSGQVPTAAEAAAVSAVRRREVLLDAATGATPTLEGLFEPVVPGGTVFTCTRRLLRETQVNYHHKTVVLLAPQGAQVSADFVTRITALLKDQQG